jgi:WD40 repeat protein
VTDVSLNPGEDMFLTASRDRTVRLWNIQQAGCMAQMDFPSETIGTPHVAFDSTGMVFTVMAEMAGGKGNVSTLHKYHYCEPLLSLLVRLALMLLFCFLFPLLHYYTTTIIYMHIYYILCMFSLFICTMLAIFQGALFPK